MICREASEEEEREPAIQREKPDDNQFKSGPIKIQIKSNQLKSNQIKSPQIKSGQIKIKIQIRSICIFLHFGWLTMIPKVALYINY